MNILAIETSCDDTAIGIIELKGDTLIAHANVLSSQTKMHNEFGGIVPNLAARAHIENLPIVLEQALEKAKMTMDDIDGVAVTRGHGLIPALLVGVSFAKGLAYRYNKPLFGANHMEGHVYSNWLSDLSLDDKSLFPAICLVVSGGHTRLILMKGHGEYELLGQTLDDAAGEAFDKIARILDMPYPGGPEISKAALDAPDKPVIDIEFPRPLKDRDDYNFSFSGLKTSVLYKVRDLTKEYSLKELTPTIAHETQEAIVDVLTHKVKRAAKEFNAKSIMLSGGVSANKVLRQSLQSTADELGIQNYVPKMQYTMDNGAMIGASTLAMMHKKKCTKKDLEQRASLDQITQVQADANWDIL